jgi:hypothetical protein
VGSGSPRLSCCSHWTILHLFDISISPWWAALSSGLGIFDAAFLLSWASELAQLDIPQALALAFLALVAVLHEYAVDMYFAWMAGKNSQFSGCSFPASNPAIEVTAYDRREGLPFSEITRHASFKSYLR